MNPPSSKTNRAGPGLAGLLFALAWATALCPTSYAEETLGRLFFSPEHRQNLDRQRQLNIQEKQEIPEDPTLTINGIVSRSSGKRTVWINGVAQNETEAPRGISVTSNRNDPGKVRVQSIDAPAAKAKVGDTINRKTGETTDLLGDGQIGIKSSAKK